MMVRDIRSQPNLARLGITVIPSSLTNQRFRSSWRLYPISVPDGILLKPGPLDPIEVERIRAHPGAGSDLVLGLRSMELVRPIMRHHHEKWDGSGYPDGLKGEAIPLGARIISVVDVFDALHTDRPYKAALPRSEAVSMLIRETDAGYWDPRVVETFLEILRDYKHDT